MKELKDFLTGGTPSGQNVEFPYGTKLSDFTAPQTGLADAAGDVYTPDDAASSISDALGQLIYFTRILKDGRHPAHNAAVAEWRGMLAEIFLSGLIGGKNEIVAHSVNLETLQENTSLYNIYLDRFKMQSENTGYDKLPKNEKKTKVSFMFYKKAYETFAMVVPGVILLPMANYDRRIFADSNWVEQRSGNRVEWDNGKILDYFRANTDQAAQFINYLNELNHKDVRGNNAAGPLRAYIDDLLSQMPQSYQASDAAAPQGTIDQVLKNGYAERADEALKPIFHGDFFTDKLLCFVPYYITDEDEGILIENPTVPAKHTDAWSCYRIDTNGKLLTPMRVNGFCGDKNDVYVVPPFNNAFLTAISGKTIRLISWSAALLDTSDKKEEIEVTIVISVNGRRLHPIKRIYAASSVLIAKTMPYISMWPFVKGSANLQGASTPWNEYFVAVHSRDFNETFTDRPTTKALDDKLKAGDINPMLQISLPELQVDIFNGNADRYQIQSNPFGRQADPDGNFLMLKTRAFPRYLQLSAKMNGTANPVLIGCWEIDESRATDLPNNGATGILGFDFATTATVLVLASGNGDPMFVDGPGAYLYDVFNPMWESDRKKTARDSGGGNPESEEERSQRREQWDLLQTYYLFGAKSEACSKIYSYGQLNGAIDNNGTPYNNTTNNVTGRAVLVEPNYLRQSVNSQQTQQTSVYTPIKWPDGADVQPKQIAATNFILNCLTWGVLAARRQGCGTVIIRASYALGRDVAQITTVLDSLAAILQAISGLGGQLSYEFFTEAQTNAGYLIDGSQYGWHDLTPPDPQNGYMLVDIGGGTTDIAVCQYADPDLPFKQKIKDEISFKYAGREIVDISLLRIPDFKNLWTVQPSPGHISRRQLRGILDSFDYNGEYSPENDRLPLLQRAIAFVGFLLDQAQISQEYAGPFVGHRMDAMKCKYLAFCWVLGRYIRRLADAGVLEVRPDRIFRIYLSGCASKGIETFIRSTDARFLSKCNEAATRGYFENNPPAGAGAFIDVTVLVHNGDAKKEIAYGLTIMQNANAGPNGQNPQQGENGLQPLINNGNAAPSTAVTAGTALNTANARNYFDMIVDVVNLLLGESVQPGRNAVNNRFGERIDDFITNINYQSNVIRAGKINVKYIFDELYALYTYEKYLDCWEEPRQ